jgi:Peptidase A4 family
VKVFNKQLTVLAAFIAIAIAGPSSSAMAGSQPVARHPIELIRDAKGDPIRRNTGEFESTNWSGYVLPKFITGEHYTAAQATWIVPQVLFDGIPSASSSWLGIGGFCKNKKCGRQQEDNSLIQLGTEQDSIDDTDVDYYAWYEMLPGAEIRTTLSVNPGDVITASLSCAAKCNKKTPWTLSMTNETTGDTWSQVVKYKSSRLSVEVIEEAPFSGGVLPLADFGIATFSDITANSVPVNLSDGVSVVMEDDQGEEGTESSNVSAPNSTMDGFAACFNDSDILATCVDTGS